MHARRHYRLGSLAALSWVLWSAPAAAECPEQALSEALGIRIDEATLRQLVDVGLTYLPDAVSLPPAEWEIFSCGFGLEAAVGTKTTNVRPEILSHQVTLEADALRVVAQVNLFIEGEVEAKLCDIPTDCQLQAIARRATISGLVRPTIESCELQSNFEDISIDVDSDDVEIELSECVIVSSVVDLVLRGFQSLILRTTLPYLEGYIMSDLPELIRESRVGVVLPSYSALGVEVAVAPDRVVFDQGSVQISAQAWSAPVGPPAACVPQGSNFAVDAIAPDPLEVVLAPQESARLAASEDFLQQLLLSAWTSGLLCFDLDALGVDLETPLQPIFPGVKLSTQIRSASAPVLTLDPNGERDVVLGVSSIVADLNLELPGDEPVVARATTGARISGRVVVDPASTAVAIEPIDLDISSARIDLPQRSVTIRQDGLAKLYDETLAPLVFGQSGRITVLDAVFAGAPVALELTGVEAQSGRLEAGLRVWEKTPNDRTPPRTNLAAVPQGPFSTAVVIETASSDDQTAAPLLRHFVSVDGVREESPRAGQRITLLGLEPGVHRVELQAVDLNDNEGFPVAVEVLVDLTPPEITLESAPIGVIGHHETEWVVGAIDDHSPDAALQARYSVEVWSRTPGVTQIFSSGSFELGSPLRLENLPEDRIVAVHFEVEDEAGNVAETTSSFALATDLTSGCRNLSGRPGWPLLGLGLALLFMRRRGARGRR